MAKSLGGRILADLFSNLFVWEMFENQGADSIFLNLVSHLPRNVSQADQGFGVRMVSGKRLDVHRVTSQYGLVKL